MTEDIFPQICSYENLERAFTGARKGKTLKPYVIEFEEKIKDNLHSLQSELLFHTYKPRPLKTFILRDPKTRKISKSDFRDRVVHHAIFNVIEPLFESHFIFDSYANRKGKGTLKALERFEFFGKKVSQNYALNAYVLKADIRHYFETVNHDILLKVLRKIISDERTLWLIKIILENHRTEESGRGMPLGNLTSQFFANVYLNELDQFVKHNLKVKYYIRYVDDFVILDNSKQQLENHKAKIERFLTEKMKLKLHPDKSKILNFADGVGFLGHRIYPYHKRITKKNIKRFERKLMLLHDLYKNQSFPRERVVECFEGWLAHISHANTFKYRKHIVRMFNQLFPLEPIQPQQITKHQNFIQKTEEASLQFSSQKTLQLHKKGKTIAQIAEKRSIKVSTVWEHLKNLIEHNQLSVWKVLPKEKVPIILRSISSETDTLKEIKSKIKDHSITYDEINCVLAYLRSKNRKKNLMYHIKWYQNVHCLRKCYFNKKQREECSLKFTTFQSSSPALELKRDDFLDLFNNHLNICVLPKKEKLMSLSWEQFQKIKHYRLGKMKKPTKEVATPPSTAKPI